MTSYTFFRLILFYLSLIKTFGTLIPAIERSSVEPNFQVNETEFRNLSTVCYYGFGCYSLNDFFDISKRFINFLPQSPSEINIKFLLYTELNSIRPQELSYNFTEREFHKTNFNPNHQSKLIIHGFITDFEETDWMGAMKDYLLSLNQGYNVFGVDWSGGSKTLYNQAVANTRLTGAMIAIFIRRICDISRANPKDFHLIGHSLGAHISGYTGEYFVKRKLGRITGLDPAGPSFQANAKETRLDPSDAEYVDVIHTDAATAFIRGFGLEATLGHIDFYPNGGKSQPGCRAHIEKDRPQPSVFCSHSRASTLAFTSVDNIDDDCQFVGYECVDYESFEQGLCSDCGENNSKCALYYLPGFDGIYRDYFIYQFQQKEKTLGKKYFFKTNDNSPWCVHHFLVTIEFSPSSQPTTGQIEMKILGVKGKVERITAFERFKNFEPGTNYTFIKTMTLGLGNIKRLDLKWTFRGIQRLNPRHFAKKPLISILKVTLKYMSHIDSRIRSEKSAILCPDTKEMISDGSSMTFLPCDSQKKNLRRSWSHHRNELRRCSY